MYGIIRIDDAGSRTHLWRVTIQRRHQITMKHFSDGVYGGRTKALKAAKMFRDEVLAASVHMTRKAFCGIRKKNNRSGVSGVTRIEQYETQRGRKRLRLYWVAQWPLGLGRAKQRKFSVLVYGEQGAYLRALKARRQALAALGGQPWRMRYSRRRSTSA